MSRPASTSWFCLSLALSLGLAVARPAVAQPVAAQPAAVTPPQILEHVDPVYPPSKLEASIDTTVTLFVTVEKDGSVSDVEVAESGGAEFDEAAMAAARRWRFTPATRGGTPIRARIRVPFHFAPGPHEAAPGAGPAQGGGAQAPAGGDAQAPAGGAPAGGAPAGGAGPGGGTQAGAGPGEPARHPDDPDGAQGAGAPPHPLELTEGVAGPHAVAEPGKPIEIHVQGRPNPPRRAASDFRIGREILAAAPHQSAAEMLTAAPGVHVAQPEGEAVAQRIFLRGFDAEHGQDIELRVGPVPLNQRSHLHGQGYADLNMIIPETVRSLRVVEGVYDPEQGDFAVAGSVGFDLGVEERGLLFKGTLGSFGARRTLALWAPEGQSEDTFGAVAVRSSDGFGDAPRGSLSGAALGQYRVALSDDFSALLHVAAYAGRAGIAGVLRRDDIDEDRVGFLDAYDDPSARSQSAAASRAQIALTVERTDDDGSQKSASLWAALSTYRSRLNFTGYTQRSRENPAWAGRGDLIEQANEDLGLGARLAYRTRRVPIAEHVTGQLALGADLQTNRIDQAQNLLQAPQNETWDRRVDASIAVTGVGAYADAMIALQRWGRLRGGVRADVLVFDIDDRLGNFIPAFQEESHIVGFRRTAAGLAWGPRVTLEVDPLRWLRVSASYGEGYRSPQARQLEEGESAPFSTVQSYEIGATARATGVSATLAAYETRLSYDLAFDAAEGRLERIGPTTRRGITAYLAGSPARWLTAGVSATIAHATLDAPPPATPEDPTPAYVEGQELPFVPPVVVRADLAVTRPVARVLDEPVEVRLGYGTTFLSPRPLPYAQVSSAVMTVDASLSARRTFLEVGVEALNLLNARLAEAEYFFVSNWKTTAVPSSLPARHIAAGAPLSILGSVTLHL